MTKKFVVVLTLFLLSACATAPVQEMSDARQALQSAKEAGVPEYSPESYQQAEALLIEAEKSLKMRQYGKAREKAMQAKQKALTARDSVMTNH